MKTMLRFVPLLMLFPLMAMSTPFSLIDTTGKKHRLDVHHGKWILVNVWATWCSPCVAEMPELESLSRSNPDLTVLGLSVDGSQNREQVTRFAARAGVTYPVIVGDMSQGQQFEVKGFPTTVLYAPSGKPVWRKTGKVTREEIEKAMKR